MGGSGVHLCGSVQLADAESVFEQVAARLRGYVRRIPDGETGERDNWVAWQLPKLKAHPDLELVPPDSPDYGPRGRMRPKPGVDPSSIVFGPLGYAGAALESWQIFDRLRRQGVIAAGTRFQVSLPTPIAVVGAFLSGPQAELERQYETRLLAELGRIADAVPAGDLAVQWDTCIEFGILEGVFPSWFGTDYDAIAAGVVRRLIRLGDAVPDGVELGYHLCYGDMGHKHFVEPSDTSKLVSVANEVAKGLRRSLNWVHMPVPRQRADADYFVPLAGLELPRDTTLYLGLVHATDGFEGGRRRIEAAAAVVGEFGIATECGMGRRSAEQIPDLLDLHARLAESLG